MTYQSENSWGEGGVDVAGQLGSKAMEGRWSSIRRWGVRRDDRRIEEDERKIEGIRVQIEEERIRGETKSEERGRKMGKGKLTEEQLESACAGRWWRSHNAM